MDSYLRRQHVLKSGEKDISIVKSRANSLEPPARNFNLDVKKDKDNNEEKNKEGNVKGIKREINPLGKIAYKDDINNVHDKIRFIQDDVLNKVDKSLKDLDEKLKVLSNKIEDKEQHSENERVKIKLDNFISTYNNNEISHSDKIGLLEKNIFELNEKINDIESVFRQML